MLDVMFYEVFDEEKRLLKEYIPHYIKADYTSLTIQETTPTTLPARLISIRTQSVIPLEWADKLQGILSRSQGYDHLIEYRKKTQTNIPCGYLNDYCSRAVAEHAIMVMMALFRKLRLQIEKFRRFDREGITGSECMGRTALVVGVGRIGSVIAEILIALKMRVLGVDIVKRSDIVKYISLDEGIRQADVIFCALPLTMDTCGMLNYNVLSKVKKGALFINISRGEIAPETDLVKLLLEKKLSGIGLDVFSDEGSLACFLRGTNTLELPEHLSSILELMDTYNVILTPHNAFNTTEAVQQKAKETAKAVILFLKEGRFHSFIKGE